MNKVSTGPQVMTIRSWPTGGTFNLLGDGAIRDWNDLGIREQEKVLKRAEMASIKGNPLDKTKIRWIQGVGAEGSLELKVQNPPLRAIGVKLGEQWYFTWIGRKPKEREVHGFGKRAVGLRDEFLRWRGK